jgi:hypothetical protein
LLNTEWKNYPAAARYYNLAYADSLYKTELISGSNYCISFLPQAFLIAALVIIALGAFIIVLTF